MFISVSKLMCLYSYFIFVFKQKTAYELRISDWSSDVCSSDLLGRVAGAEPEPRRDGGQADGRGCGRDVPGHGRAGGTVRRARLRPHHGGGTGGDPRASLSAAPASPPAPARPLQIGSASCRERVCQ